MKPAAREAGTSRRTRWFVLWMLLLACAFVGFVALGNWQVRRLHWKVALIHDVDARVHAPPVAAPGPAQWPRVRIDRLHYLHVRLVGHYIQGKQTLVHGGSAKGYGYWVMTPFQTTQGFIVLVNRGFVPPGLSKASAQAVPGQGEASSPSSFRRKPESISAEYQGKIDSGVRRNDERLSKPRAGLTTVTGLLRYSEPNGSFMRDNQPQAGQWYSRDVAAIATARDLPQNQVAPYFVDADATPADADYPVAGLTKIHFRNTHLGYAITWYLLALGSLLAAGIVIRHQWRARRLPQG